MTGMHSALSQLLDVQGGVVTSAQALTFLTRRGLEAQLNAVALHRVRYGIYGRGDLTTALRLRGLDLVAADVRYRPVELVRRLEMRLERARAA
jgi:hypothetical protein